MPKGGARANSGPPPDPNALRRERKSDAAGWVTLPADGRAGDPPVFPLADPSARELELWVSEWRRPQAVEWERAGQEVEVALFVRTLVGAESPKATAAERTLVRQQMEALGISQPGLARNRWRIGGAGAVQQSGEVAPPARQTSSARDRLRVVNSA